MAQTVGSYAKAPGDTLFATVDFTPDLPSGVTVANATTTVVSGGTLAVTTTTTNGTTVTPRLTGGKAGQTYKLLVEGTYSDGQVRGFGVDVIVT